MVSSSADRESPGPSGGPSTLRTCTMCGAEKGLGEYYFYSRTNKPYSRCKPCSRAASSRSAESNRDETLRRRRAQYQEAPEEHRQRSRDYTRRMREANPVPPRPSPDDPRTCTSCGQLKDAEHFRVKVKATGRREAKCIPCGRAYAAEKSRMYRAANPERAAAVRRASEDKNRDRRNARARSRRLDDIEAARAKDRANEAAPHRKAARLAYRQSHADQIREKNRRYLEKAADKARAYHANYRRLHPELYRAATRKWQGANPEKAASIKRVARHRRRATLANVEGSFTNHEWLAVLERHEHRCWICGMCSPLVKLTVDHIIPISKGGTNYASNLAPACGRCNSFKGNRLMGYPSIASREPSKRRRPTPISMA